MDHVAGHDVAGLPLLFDPHNEFVFKFWALTLLFLVASLVLKHAFELFNLLVPITNFLFTQNSRIAAQLLVSWANLTTYSLNFAVYFIRLEGIFVNS